MELQLKQVRNSASQEHMGKRNWVECNVQSVVFPNKAHLIWDSVSGRETSALVEDGMTSLLTLGWEVFTLLRYIFLLLFPNLETLIYPSSEEDDIYDSGKML